MDNPSVKLTDGFSLASNLSFREGIADGIELKYNFLDF
jgi:hypothetical protein